MTDREQESLMRTSKSLAECSPGPLVREIATAYESGFGHGVAGRGPLNPYVSGSFGAEAWEYGHWCGTKRRAPETCEQQAIAEDVRLLGIGFAMHTAAGVKRLAPEDVTFRPPLRCLAMINEFADKVCSLPESHGGSHVWVTPEKARGDVSAFEQTAPPLWDCACNLTSCPYCGPRLAQNGGPAHD